LGGTWVGGYLGGGRLLGGGWPAGAVVLEASHFEIRQLVVAPIPITMMCLELLRRAADNASVAVSVEHLLAQAAPGGRRAGAFPVAQPVREVLVRRDDFVAQVAVTQHLELLHPVRRRDRRLTPTPPPEG
jgi:hypothetical protein